MGKSVSDADAPAATGPQLGNRPTPAVEPPVSPPRRPRPVPEPSALPAFTVEKWGPAAFLRRLRWPALSALTISGFLLYIGPAANGIDVLPFLLLSMLLHLFYGLNVSLPLLRARALRVGADGISVRHGPHALTVPWRDITAVTLAGTRNRHRIALTAALQAGADTRVPAPLRAGPGVLVCTVVSAAKDEKNTRLEGIDTALRNFAGSRYHTLPAAP